MAKTSRTRRAAQHRKIRTKTAASRHGQAAVSVRGIKLTHPDRVYWRDAGVTKRMLAEYYAEVWDLMRPHIAGRVLALVRCPEGAEGPCFFQKHASAGVDATQLHLVREPKGEKSISIDNLKGLIALVQAGVLELHVRGSSIERLEEANRLVFDLDPGPGVAWPALVDAAREVRDRLRERELESFVKVTGGKGLHVVLPIRFAPWDRAKTFCHGIAAQMAADSPGRYTATARKSARRGRIFVDYLRNSREATAIAPYSTRARPGATVAVPLAWEELAAQHGANRFTVNNLAQRLARIKSDPWREIGRLRQRLPDDDRGLGLADC